MVIPSLAFLKYMQLPLHTLVLHSYTDEASMKLITRRLRNSCSLTAHIRVTEGLGIYHRSIEAIEDLYSSAGFENILGRAKLGSTASNEKLGEVWGRG